MGNAVLEMAEVGIPSNFVRFLSSLGLHCMTIIRFTGKGNDEHWYYQIATKIKLVIPIRTGAPRNTSRGSGCARVHHTNITRSALDRVVRNRLLQGELSQPEGCLRL